MGMTIFGVLLIGYAGVLVLVSIGLGLGESLIIDNTPPTWLLIAVAALGLVVAYRVFRAGLGLTVNPARDRRKAELAMWVGVPVVWIALVGVNLLLTGGQDDVAVWPLLAAAGLVSSAVLISGALYLRSTTARSYFEDISPKGG
jgi:hypothetical protein